MNRSQGFRLPLQDAFEHFLINPVTNWSRFFNPQFFISYNGADVEVENHVLQVVGSYGKQLGQMQDALTVLLSRLPIEELRASWAKYRVQTRYHLNSSGRTLASVYGDTAQS